MRISLGNSKLAKRFAWLFIFCAFIPTLLLVLVSYERISSQMVEQNVAKLTKDTKTYGLSLFDRLVRINDQLHFMARLLQLEGLESKNLNEILRPESLELFDGIGLLTSDGSVVGLYGETNFSEILNIKERYRGVSDAGAIQAFKSVDQPSRLYMSYMMNLPQSGETLLFGKINIPHLWGVGAVGLLPPSTELAVYSSDGDILISTYASPGEHIDKFAANRSSKNLRSFAYSYDDKHYYAGLWTLFLQSRFEAGSWLIALSQPEEYILGSLKNFRTHLFSIIILGLLTVLYFSITLIRKRLTPLDVLKSRTQQIAEKDFTSEVEVNSGDEFEELADSFNIMSRQLHSQFSALETIDKIDRAILSSLKLPEIINTTLPMIYDFFSCDLVMLGRLLDGSDKDLKGHIFKGTYSEPIIKHLSINSWYKEKIFEKSDPISIQNNSDRTDYFSDLRLEKYSVVLSAKLNTNNITKGILLLAHKNVQSYDEDKLKQVRQLADQVAIALSNSGLVDDLEKLATGTIEALARTVDAKSKWTSGHSERVADLAGQIGSAMGLSAEHVQVLYRGGLLHDIGKIGVPVRILDKAAKLTDEEFKEIKNHPEIGAKILEPIEVYQDILTMVLHHHERYDGKGYPHGLVGEEADLNARILTVADVYDALNSSRPYREGWVKQKAIDYIISHTGSQFDPAVVRAFKVAIM